MNKTCMAELVSMIIPVYNTPEQFLDECLDSVRKQSYKELEVILVDDGSDSKTAAYLDTIAGKDFVVLHKENGGVSAARNYGVQHANGKYICFVDSDDLISEKFVSSLYRGIKENQTRISACCLEKVKDSLQKKEPNEDISFERYVGEDIWRKVNTGYCATKMYDRTVFHDTKFDENVFMCEDALFINCVLNKAGECCATQSVLYYYRDNPRSFSCTAKASKYRQAIEVSKEILTLDRIAHSEENRRRFKTFQAVWELKYMLALSNENTLESRTQIQKEKRIYCAEVLPYTVKAKDKRVKLGNYVAQLPDGIALLCLKMMAKALRR